MLRGAKVMRIVWMPGTDLLEGICHCSATHVCNDPLVMWDWLLAHPVGHESYVPAPATPHENPRPAASLASA